MKALAPFPHRYFVLKLRGHDSYRYMLAFADLVAPTEGRYGEAKFPDGLNILLTEEDWKILSKVNEKDLKESTL